MGTRTYKSDEFDRFSEREARKREWYEREMKKKRQALAILIGMGIAALAVLVLIIVLLVKLFSPKDTAEVENNLSKTPSGEISLVDNQTDELSTQDTAATTAAVSLPQNTRKTSIST